MQRRPAVASSRNSTPSMRGEAKPQNNQERIPLSRSEENQQNDRLAVERRGSRQSAAHEVFRRLEESTSGSEPADNAQTEAAKRHTNHDAATRNGRETQKSAQIRANPCPVSRERFKRDTMSVGCATETKIGKDRKLA